MLYQKNYFSPLSKFWGISGMYQLCLTLAQSYRNFFICVSLLTREWGWMVLINLGFEMVWAQFCNELFLILLTLLLRYKEVCFHLWVSEPKGSVVSMLQSLSTVLILLSDPLNPLPIFGSSKCFTWSLLIVDVFTWKNNKFSNFLN